MSFLCGFGKKKNSKKEDAYTKASSVSHQSQIAESKHSKEMEKNTPPETVHSRNKVPDIHKNGKLCVPASSEPEDQKQETGKEEIGPVTSNSNAIKPDHTNTAMIHSYQEAQGIERSSEPSEQMMSEQKITSSDIVSTGSQMHSTPTDDHGLNKSGEINTVPSGSSQVPRVQKDTGLYYKMNHQRRGTCLIVNVGEFLPTSGQPNRDGYLEDGELMNDTFTTLGFEIQYVKNPTMMKLNKALDEVLQSIDRNTNDVDCLAVVIMSHGHNKNNNDTVYTTDGATISLVSIIEKFNGENCPRLVGKPKLFFVQACRGAKSDPGKEIPYIDEGYDEIDSAHPVIIKIPIEADILLSQATASGYVSFRSYQKGSIYIRNLNKALAEHAYDEDILSILTQVNRMVAFEYESSCKHPEYHAKKQMPTFESRLTKKLQFCPPRKLNSKECQSSLHE